MAAPKLDDSPFRSTPKSAIPPWIHDRNPFFTLSGIFMLAGCFLVNHATHDPEVVPLKPLIITIGLFNIYNVIAAALAVWFIQKRNLQRDACALLAVPVLLAGDAALLYTELMLQHRGYGWAFAILGFGVALSLTLGVTRSLGGRPSRAVLGSITTLLLAIYILPAFLAWSAEGRWLTAWTTYALSWLAAGGVVWAWCIEWKLRVGRFCGEREHTRFVYAFMRWLPRVLAVLFVLHVASTFRLFLTPLTLPHLAPLALAIGVLTVLRGGPNRLAHSLAWALVAVVLSWPAVLVNQGIQAGQPTWPQWLPIDGIEVTPWRIMLLAAGVLIGAQTRYGRGLAAPAWALAFVWFGFMGSTPRQSWLALDNLRPDSTLQWGYWGIAAAFICLGLGLRSVIWPRVDTET